jgi:hypothetical protein
MQSRPFTEPILTKVTIYQWYCVSSVSWDSVVGLATRYRLDGPGIESWWWRDFLQPSRPTLGTTQLPTQCVPGLSRGKAAGAWR